MPALIRSIAPLANVTVEDTHELPPIEGEAELPFALSIKQGDVRYQDLIFTTNGYKPVQGDVVDITPHDGLGLIVTKVSDAPAQ